MAFVYSMRRLLDKYQDEEDDPVTDIPVVQQWLAKRRTLHSQFVGEDMAATVAYNNAAAALRDTEGIEGYLPEHLVIQKLGTRWRQDRLYMAHQYIDDSAFAVCGLKRTIFALRAWSHITTQRFLV